MMPVTMLCLRPCPQNYSLSLELELDDPWLDKLLLDCIRCVVDERVNGAKNGCLRASDAVILFRGS